MAIPKRAPSAKKTVAKKNMVMIAQTNYLPHVQALCTIMTMVRMDFELRVDHSRAQVASLWVDEEWLSEACKIQDTFFDFHICKGDYVPKNGKPGRSARRARRGGAGAP